MLPSPELSSLKWTTQNTLLAVRHGSINPPFLSQIDSVYILQQVNINR